MVILMNGGPITWSSRLQKITAQSSAESEIYAVCEAVKEAIHIKLLCEETGIRQPNIPMAVYEDNSACIALGHSLKNSKPAKHFQVRLRFLQEHVRDKTTEFEKVDTKEQLADGFTKALPRAIRELPRAYASPSGQRLKTFERFMSDCFQSIPICVQFLQTFTYIIRGF